MHRPLLASFADRIALYPCNKMSSAAEVYLVLVHCSQYTVVALSTSSRGRDSSIATQSLLYLIHCCSVGISLLRNLLPWILLMAIWIVSNIWSTRACMLYRAMLFRATAKSSVWASLLLISIAPCVAVTRFLMADSLSSCLFISCISGCRGGVSGARSGRVACFPVPRAAPCFHCEELSWRRFLFVSWSIASRSPTHHSLRPLPWLCPPGSRDGDCPRLMALGLLLLLRSILSLEGDLPFDSVLSRDNGYLILLLAAAPDNLGQVAAVTAAFLLWLKCATPIVSAVPCTAS